MVENVLVTGPPRCGKTTVIERTVGILSDSGLTIGGTYSPELIEDGVRVGFELVEIGTDRSWTLAHVDREEGPAVGKYRVDVGAVDEAARQVLPRAREEADIVVVDEIAPMQVTSDVFIEETRRTLDADVPVLAAIHRSVPHGFIADVKSRSDVEHKEVTETNRDQLPERLADRLHTL